MNENKDRLSLLSIDTDQVTLDLANTLYAAFPVLHDFMLVDSNQNRELKNRSVLVIGGGIVGLLTAFFLAMEGFQVTVLEKQSYGAAASGRNGGGILALGRDLHEIPLIKISIDLWEQLHTVGIKTHFQKTGHAMVAMNEYERKKLEDAQIQYARVGLQTELLDSKELVRKLPDLNPDNFGALYSTIDAQGYPFEVITSVVKILRSLNSQLVNHCEVIGFNVNNGRICSAVTNQGEFKGDYVVLCPGPWTEKIGNMLDIHLPILPRRSQILVTETVKQRRMNPFVSGNNLYLRQTHRGNLLFGGGGAWEKTGFDVSNSVDVINRLSTYFTELFPGFQSLHLIRAFAGTVEITADHKPLLGAIEEYSNAYVSAGYSGHGYGMSAFSAKLLAKKLAFDSLDQLFPPSLELLFQAFSPSRFTISV